MTKRERDELRTAVANYIRSEGCSFCGDYEQHQKDTAALGRLLRVPKFKDGSGFNFGLYETKKP